MTADMILRRKSDGLILSDMISAWSDWQPLYSHFEHQTQAGTYYPQNLGYASEVQELTLLVASHYPNSTPERFRALWQAQRRNHTLTFRDAYGETHDCRLFSVPGLDTSERWSEVVTKTITKRTVQIIKLSWYT